MGWLLPCLAPTLIVGVLIIRRRAATQRRQLRSEQERFADAWRDQPNENAVSPIPDQAPRA